MDNFTLESTAQNWDLSINYALQVATSQTQFGLNLLKIYLRIFSLNLKILEKILVKFPVKSQKVTKNFGFL